MGAVFSGILGKITYSGTVIGGCDSGRVSYTRDVAEFSAISQQDRDIAAGTGTGTFEITGAWAGSRFLDVLKATGSGWNVIFEMTGGCVMIASGCLATDGEWTETADGIAADRLSGRCVTVYASGTTLN